MGKREVTSRVSRNCKIETVVSCVSALCEAFRRTPSQVTFASYEIGLDGLSDQEVALATEKALKTSKFMPSPAELRELAGLVGGKDRAVLAWEVVLKNIRIGPYKHVDFDDGIINATIRNLGGWNQFLLRFSGVDAEMWLRRDFLETYSSLQRSGVGSDSCGPLAGLSEACVVNGQLMPPVPVKIATGLPKVDTVAPRRIVADSVSGLLTLRSSADDK